MLTLFTIPKTFPGHIGIIQRNAIKSWTLLRPHCEIILLGDDEGTADVAREFAVRHIAKIARNEFGTPLINDAFRMAEKLSNHDFCCFINSDIILMNDFMEAAQRLTRWKEYFLMVGRPWNFRVNELLDFGPAWGSQLRMQVSTRGELRSVAAIDYFLFRRGIWGDIPPFAIGRPGYDNWLIYRARSRKVSVVDATQAVMAVHQNHEYPAHLQVANGVRRNSPEAKQNLELAAGSSRIFTLLDATHLMTSEGPKRPFNWRHLCRRFTCLPVLYPRFGLPLKLLAMAGDVSRPIRVRLGLTLNEKAARHE